MSTKGNLDQIIEKQQQKQSMVNFSEVLQNQLQQLQQNSPKFQNDKSPKFTMKNSFLSKNKQNIKNEQKIGEQKDQKVDINNDNNDNDNYKLHVNIKQDDYKLQTLENSRHSVSGEVQQNQLKKTGFMKKATIANNQQNLSPFFMKNTTRTTSQRYEFIQHSTDFAFVLELLDISANDTKIFETYQENPNLKLVKKYLSSENNFKDYLQNLNKNSFNNLFEAISNLYQTQYLYFNLILKLKKVINSSAKMYSSLNVQDAFKTIIEHTCKILECDRASVYLVDHRKNELWTKVQKDSQKIVVPIGVGFAGIVAERGELLNVFDAQKDNRFNKEADIKNHYETKSVMTCPIFDGNSKNSRVIGVIQAVNKIKEGFFLKDDEGMFLILSRLSQVVLKNSMYNDDKIAYHNSMRQLLQIGILINSQRSLQQLLHMGKQNLLEIFNSQKAKIYLYNDKNDKLYNYEGENNSLQEFPSDSQSSICGEVFRTGQKEFLNNIYNNVKFNALIDIDTQIPILCFPIKAQNSEGSHIIGVLQIINQKGISDLANESKIRDQKSFYETIEQFALIFGQACYNIQNPGNEELIQFNDDI